MLEAILSVAIVLGITIYLIRFYKHDVEPETFSEGDTVQIGNPYHPDHPKNVTIVGLQSDSCTCRFDDGSEKVLKRSDLTKQSF